MRTLDCNHDDFAATAHPDLTGASRASHRVDGRL
jgi:hypothetical protein